MGAEVQQSFEAVPVPGALGVRDSSELEQEVRLWIESSAFRALLDGFGGPEVNGQGTVELLDSLADFSAAAWDFRRHKGERSVIDSVRLGDALEALTVQAADALGLVHPRLPSRREYDSVLILGGLVRGCFWRSEYSAALVDRGVRADRFSALTAYRPIGSGEVELLSAFGHPGLGSEDEVMGVAVAEAFGVDSLDVVETSALDVSDNLRWHVAEGTSRLGLTVDVLVAPPADPSKQRADSTDTYRFWASRFVGRPSSSSVLLVTTPIYVPYQHAAAVTVLGLEFGVTVETVGYDMDLLDDRGVPQGFGAAHYLQEIRSAILGFRGLLLAAKRVAK